MQSNWYEHFFHGLALDMWRNAVSEAQTQEEAAFVADVLNVQHGADLLDIPCGMGRLALPLARMGYRVTGVDLSEPSIAQAREDGAGLAIDWILTDMTRVDKACDEEKFDGAFCFGNSFSYTDYETTARFLNAVSRTLKRRARFVLDTGLAAESLLPNLQTRKWYPLGDMYMLSEASYDAASSRLETRYTFIKGAAIQKETATYYVYTVAELKRLFSMCGWEVEALYGSTGKDPYAFGTPRLLMVCRNSR